MPLMECSTVIGWTRRGCWWASGSDSVPVGGLVGVGERPDQCVVRWQDELINLADGCDAVGVGDEGGSEGGQVGSVHWDLAGGHAMIGKCSLQDLHGYSGQGGRVGPQDGVAVEKNDVGGRSLADQPTSSD